MSLKHVEHLSLASLLLSHLSSSLAIRSHVKDLAINNYNYLVLTNVRFLQEILKLILCHIDLLTLDQYSKAEL